MTAKIFRYIMLGAAMSLLCAACGRDNEDFYAYESRPEEPGDAAFGSAELRQGPSLYDAARINVRKIPRISKANGIYPADAEGTWTTEGLPERLRFFEKFIKEDMVFVEGGTFLMGSTAEQGSEIHIHEIPVHQVTVSDFYICKFEVTQELYSYVMGRWENFTWKDPGTRRLPMENRLFSEMQTFCDRLNEITGLHFMLPTEAQWEFAARGGRKRTSTLYAGSDDFDAVAVGFSNCYRLIEGQETMQFCPAEVGSKAPNELGLYDMSGNMAEACLDWYVPYTGEYQIDPTGPASLPESASQKHICRGGGWNTTEKACRVAARSAFASNSSSDRKKYIGFRLVHPKID